MSSPNAEQRRTCYDGAHNEDLGVRDGEKHG